MKEAIFENYSEFKYSDGMYVGAWECIACEKETLMPYDELPKHCQSCGAPFMLDKKEAE